MDEQMIDHERIWLQPKCCASEFDGRQWCQDNVFDECEKGAKATEYVRADVIAGKVAELERHVHSLIGLIEANSMPLSKQEYRYVQDARAALAPYPERRSE